MRFLMHFFLVLVACFCLSYSQAQTPLKVGEQTPKLIVSDYILNASANTQLEGKFLVLEFWATWCAPCLEAVPHLNSLQEQFKTQKNLLFVSLTYEKPEKVKRTLSRIPFKTIVASDQSKSYEAAFNVKAIPQTVLIDKKNIVQWIGMPDKLTSSMIEQFLRGEPVISQAAEEKKATTPTDLNTIQPPINTEEVGMQIIRSPTTKYFYSLALAEAGGNTTLVNSLEKRGIYLATGMQLGKQLAALNKVKELQINLPEELSKQYFNIIYRNTNRTEEAVYVSDLKQNILKSLGLKESMEPKTLDIYFLVPTDSKKLAAALASEQELFESSSENKTHWLFSNSALSTITQTLAKEHKIIIENNTGLTGKYDFIITKGNLDLLLSELKLYGLTLEKQSVTMNIFSYR
ncbi:MAG: DUF3738 domain-containing protein [Cytophagales bacterium]|nr:MAG: DUF3738 domain-containing protein [Cytophagales bacterium]TAF59367.1 MAG: DUF3738 domain-containing protein [Cytophagales bacterium]